MNDNLPLFCPDGERVRMNPNQELPDPFYLIVQYIPSKHVLNVLIHLAKRIVLVPRLRFYWYNEDPRL